MISKFSDIALAKLVTASAIATAILVLFLTGAPFAQEMQQELYMLGKVHFAVSCSEEAQQEFNRGIGLLHHMTYPQAKTAFQQVLEIDPTCSMAHWGIAMTLFQPLWPTRPGPNELQQGWKAIQNAKILAPPTEREQLYIAAVEAFFRYPKETGYWERIRRWEHAMEILYYKYPNDHEVKAWYSLSLLAKAKISANPLEYHNRVAELLISIHQENALHPGSIHYLIHANDIRGREHELLEIVRSYGTIAPRNPHALHMPTHIFTRLGRWQEVISWNHKAAEAALDHPAGDEGQYIWDEFPHAIEYLVYAYLQQGDDNTAAVQLEHLKSKKSLQPTFKTAFHLSSIPVRYVLERRAWQEATELVPREYDILDWDRFLWPEAITWFAKGLGAARLGKIDEASLAYEHLQKLEDTSNSSGEKLFTPQIRILRIAVSAWIAHIQGKEKLSLELMQEAADLEAITPKSPVTPAPTLPAYELLGDLFMEQNKPGKALEAFERSLELHPNRFNSLFGAARAARGLEDIQLAENFYAALLKTSVPESNRAGYREAMKYLGR